MTFRSQRGLGVAQILLSGFCFGFLGLFGKFAYSKGVTPGEVLSLRYIIAGLLLFSYLLITKPSRLKLTLKAFLWSCVLGSLGYAVFSYCYFLALQGLSVSLTVLLLYLYPIFVAAGAWVFLGESIPKGKRLALPLAMIGLLLLVGGEFSVQNALSLSAGIAAAVFYSIYILCSSRFLAGVDTLPSVAYMQLAAGITLAACHWRSLDRIVDVIELTWQPLIALAVVCSIAAMSLFLAGLKRLKSWEASILSTAEPITSICIAFIWLGERLHLPQVLGTVLVFAAFVIVSIPSKGPRHAR